RPGFATYSTFLRKELFACPDCSRATPIPQITNVQDGPISPPQMRHSPTYYAGAKDPAAATRIELPPSTRLPAIDVTLMDGPPLQVHGRILTDFTEDPSFTLFLFPRDGSSGLPIQTRIGQSPQKEFDFVIPNVP